MPVDAGIYGLIQQPKLVAPQVNPLEQLAQAMQVQGAQYSLRKAQREDADTNALNEVYAQAIGADGKTDRNKLVQLAAQRNLGSKLPGIQKQFSDADMADAKLQETKLHAQKQRIEVSGQAMGALRADPSLANAHATIDLLAQHGVYSPEQAAQFKAGFERDPSIIPTFADRMFRMALSAKDQLGKVESRNLGGTTQTTSTDPVSGKVTVVNSVQNTATPGDLLAHGDRVATRNQAERHFSAGQNTPEYKQGEDGNWYALPKKIAPGQQPTATAVMGPDGKPLGASQGKAPGEFMKGMTGVNELSKALDSYEQALKEAGGPSMLAVGDKRAKMQGAFTALKMGLKNAFELGALTGPDVAVLEGMLVDPTSYKTALIDGDTGVAAQIGQVRSYLKNREAALESTYSRQNPAKKGAASAPAAPAGDGAVPADIAAILAKHGGK